MASRRMETKPVITCLKTLLIIYSFVFWVSGHAGPAAALPSIGQFILKPEALQKKPIPVFGGFLFAFPPAPQP
uniref:Uncharacterized protein n=1 Tax=Bos indicus x Bos taurus TaxID=30522 RepID=A0A4W2BT49_BOBOX